MSTNTMPLKYPGKLFLGGEWVSPSTARTIDVIDSGTEELFGSVAEAQESDVDRAVAAAREAFDHGPWPRLSHAERAQYLRAIATEMDARAEDTALIWTIESGFLHGMARMGAKSVASIYTYYADLADTFPFIEQRQPGPGSGNVGLLIREPVGVVAAIIPWNGPASTIAYKIAPALIA
jgi:aldehyde dehydrogenase (NAD+)